jgi:hypothetical protein
MIVISVAEIALLSIVNGYGSNATAAYGAVNQVVNYVQFPALSIAITASILGAQAIGAGQPDRLRAITRTGLKMNLVITGVLVVLGYLFSRHLIALFITSEPVIELAQKLLHIMLWSSLVFGFASVLGGVMRASGTVLVPTRSRSSASSRSRCPRRLGAEPPHRPRRRVDGLPDHLHRHAAAADGVLQAGVAQEEDRAAGATCPRMRCTACRHRKLPRIDRLRPRLHDGRRPPDQ